MKTKFTGNDRYEFNHGRKPRGTGLWMFQVTGFQRGFMSTDLGRVEGYGSLTEAKRSCKMQAHSRAQEAGCTEVHLEVLP